MQETWVRSLGQEDPLGKKWQPPPVLLPGNSHEQRLPDYSPWDHKESDTTERLHPLTKDRKSRCRLLFPTLSITDLPGWNSLWFWGHCRIFLINHCQVCSIFGIHSLNICDSYFPKCANRDVSRHCQMSLGNTDHPQLRIIYLKWQVSSSVLRHFSIRRKLT